MLNDKFDLDSLARSIGANSPKLCVLDCIDSTNEQAKRMAIEGERDTVLIAAAEQTAGRGRLGRSFYSPEKTGVYFSILQTVRKKQHQKSQPLKSPQQKKMPLKRNKR